MPPLGLDAEESRAGPACAGYCAGDLGERTILPAFVSEAAIEHVDAMQRATPFTGDHRSGFERDRRCGNAICIIGGAKFLETPPRLPREAAMPRRLNGPGQEVSLSEIHRRPD